MRESCEVSVEFCSLFLNSWGQNNRTENTLPTNNGWWRTSKPTPLIQLDGSFQLYRRTSRRSLLFFQRMLADYSFLVEAILVIYVPNEGQNGPAYFLLSITHFSSSCSFNFDTNFYVFDLKLCLYLHVNIHMSLFVTIKMRVGTQ